MRFPEALFDWNLKKSDPNDTLFSDLVSNYDDGSPKGFIAGLLRLPFDSAIPGRPGARFAPDKPGGALPPL